jgi:hypothetical protein
MTMRVALVPFRRRRFPRLPHALESVERQLLCLPVVRWQAWQAVIILSRPRKAAARA